MRVKSTCTAPQLLADPETHQLAACKTLDVHPDVVPQAKRGTPCYMAPELFSEGATHSTASDLWSLGCVLYECATGSPPFMDSSFNKLVTDILSKEPPAVTGAGQDQAASAAATLPLLTTCLQHGYPWHYMCLTSFLGALPVPGTQCVLLLLLPVFHPAAASLLQLPCCAAGAAGASPAFSHLLSRLLDKNPATRIKWQVCAHTHHTHTTLLTHVHTRKHAAQPLGIHRVLLAA